jgi:phage shock protein E
MNNLYFWILLLLLIYFIMKLRQYARYSVFKISIDDAKKLLLDPKTVVIDVRTVLERNIGYYNNSIHIPASNIDNDLMKLNLDKKTNIIVYCNTGQRAKRAAEKIFKLGYCNVRYIIESYLSL